MIHGKSRSKSRRTLIFEKLDCIAIARQIFQNKVFFFTSWGSFPCKKEEKVFMKNLPGASNIMQ
jgi:hypothetical protein